RRREQSHAHARGLYLPRRSGISVVHLFEETHMRAPMRLIVALLLTFGSVSLLAQITSNPLPAPIQKGTLAVQIRDLVRLPDTRGVRPLDQDVSPAGWARVSFVRDSPDGRRFANDSRGLLYLIDASNQP